MRDFVQRGGFWVVSQALLFLVLAVLALRFRSESRRPAAVIAGGILLSSGAGLALAGAIALGRDITPFPKPSERARLVRSGAFSLIRHPIYAGVTFASLGWAIVSKSRPALLMAFGLIPFFDAKARQEEKWLREKFSAYAEYEQDVKRFIPLIY
ncbi:MAG TPA: isoprenylcysteine carboxylmethyltransferase family protein [Terrimicrobiaceae bacterium]